MVERRASPMVLKSLKHHDPVYIVSKLFSFGSSGSSKKIHNSVVKVQTRSQLETSKELEWQRRAFPRFKLHMSLIELQTGWEVMCLETVGVGESLHLLPSVIYLPVICMESIICCEGMVYDENASGRAGAAGHWAMNRRP